MICLCHNLKYLKFSKYIYIFLLCSCLISLFTTFFTKYIYTFLAIIIFFINTDYALECSICHKKFARHSNLAQHKRIHTNERPFKCKYCPSAFKQRHRYLFINIYYLYLSIFVLSIYSLNDHERLHTGEKPFVCPFCGKQFVAKCNQMVHLRIHTGEKPYQCRICQKKYASRSGYNSHIKKAHI